MEDFTAVRQSDNVLHVVFRTEAIQNTFRSEQEGRPVFEDVEMIQIIAPGDKNNVIDTKVDETHRNRFPDQYRRFKANAPVGVQGWPLKEWAALTQSQVKELNYHEVHTVEQLANLSDAVTNKLGMGYADLRTKAKGALTQAAGSAEAEAAALHTKRLEDELLALRQEMNALAATKGKPGPKPKAEALE